MHFGNLKWNTRSVSEKFWFSLVLQNAIISPRFDLWRIRLFLCTWKLKPSGTLSVYAGFGTALAKCCYCLNCCLPHKVGMCEDKLLSATFSFPKEDSSSITSNRRWCRGCPVNNHSRQRCYWCINSKHRSSHHTFMGRVKPSCHLLCSGVHHLRVNSQTDPLEKHLQLSDCPCLQITRIDNSRPMQSCCVMAQRCSVLLAETCTSSQYVHWVHPDLLKVPATFQQIPEAICSFACAQRSCTPTSASTRD